MWTKVVWEVMRWTAVSAWLTTMVAWAVLAAEGVACFFYAWPVTGFCPP